jgi:cytochrome c peroxidase
MKSSQAILLVMIATVLAAGQGYADPLPKEPPFPKDNPSTPEKIGLGKMLYFDGRLSKTGKVSCNSCHDVMGRQWNRQ